MAKSIKDLLTGLGRPAVFSDDELSQYASRWTEPLKAIRVLEPFDLSGWYCEECEDEHDYIDLDGKRYQACPDDPTAILKEAVTSSSKRWQLNWEKLRDQFCLQNMLSPQSLECPSGFFPIGARTGQLVFLTNKSNAQELLAQLQELQKVHSQPELIIVNAALCRLSDPQSAILTGLKVHHFQIEELIDKQWILPLGQDEGKMEAVLVLDPASQTIIIHGESYSFPPNSAFLFRTAQVLVAAEGTLVGYGEFDNLYYQIESTGVTGGTVALSDYAGKLNRLLPTKMPSILSGQRVFQNVRGQGYKVHSDFLPVEIRS